MKKFFSRCKVAFIICALAVPIVASVWSSYTGYPPPVQEKEEVRTEIVARAELVVYAATALNLAIPCRLEVSDMILAAIKDCNFRSMVRKDIESLPDEQRFDANSISRPTGILELDSAAFSAKALFDRGLLSRRVIIHYAAADQNFQHKVTVMFRDYVMETTSLPEPP